MTFDLYFQLIESCVKNCGQLIHDEVCTKTFMEELRELVKHATAENVKQKILEILQTWGMAFRNQSKYRIVTVGFSLIHLALEKVGWSMNMCRYKEEVLKCDQCVEFFKAIHIFDSYLFDLNAKHYLSLFIFI